MNQTIQLTFFNLSNSRMLKVMKTTVAMMLKQLLFKGLSKKETCLRGRVAVWPFGRNYEPFYKPFFFYLWLL